MNGALKYWRKQKMWDNFNEIFPTGKVEIDGETITRDFLISNGISSIGFPMLKPIRTSIENEIQFIWNSDGTMKAFYNYRIFPDGMPDNISVLNTYGRKIYNDYMANRNK